MILVAYGFNFNFKTINRANEIDIYMSTTPPCILLCDAENYKLLENQSFLQALAVFTLFRSEKSLSSIALNSSGTSIVGHTELIVLVQIRFWFFLEFTCCSNTGIWCVILYFLFKVWIFRSFLQRQSNQLYIKRRTGRWTDRSCSNS